jgi:hypothetical protein
LSFFWIIGLVAGKLFFQDGSHFWAEGLSAGPSDPDLHGQTNGICFQSNLEVVIQSVGSFILLHYQISTDRFLDFL